ncbi:MAG TPA: 16S rRNA (cytidine(1402)-2'-O)-methyltransferase [Erysipelotrichaceae bacterium]|nr:16S rRNA (cytidine(1402)-2'-O)-methyltransferase [Erysipelotrichaceae bacterium]
MTRNKSFKDNGPLLYLIATPIGNLKEFSFRAIEVIKEMDIIAAEDTRNTRFLLDHFGLKKELFSLREHNEKEASKRLLELIKNGKKVAYMSDAGYPCISDPGYYLVQEMIANNIPVSTISGSSAFINALVASGLDTKHFFFYGFLSKKENEAREEISSFKNFRDTIILYEAPHRIIRTLNLLKEILGNRYGCLARELTKINEEYIRGTLEELSQIEEESLKGEMVLLIEGNKEETKTSDEQLIKRVDYLTNLGLTKKDAISVTAEEYDINKNYIKKLILK